MDGGPRDVEEWRSLVSQFFPAERVDEALRVMRCESLGDPLAYNSSSGASGLFQFIPGTWGWASPHAGYTGASPFDPEANVATAAWLVQTSIDQGKSAWIHWSCKP
ncbi:MAG: lytic transglycosylase domain-containing protein [bacterium]|nr:lytic transglycosylase domain-containing protein [bacterium]